MHLYASGQNRTILQERSKEDGNDFAQSTPYDTVHISNLKVQMYLIRRTRSHSLDLRASAYSAKLSPPPYCLLTVDPRSMNTAQIFGKSVNWPRPKLCQRTANSHTVQTTHVLALLLFTGINKTTDTTMSKSGCALQCPG